MTERLDFTNACVDCPPLVGIDPNDRQVDNYNVIQTRTTHSDYVMRATVQDARYAANIAVLPPEGPGSSIVAGRVDDKLAEVTERMAGCRGPCAGSCPAGLYRYPDRPGALALGSSPYEEATRANVPLHRLDAEEYITEDERYLLLNHLAHELKVVVATMFAVRPYQVITLTALQKRLNRLQGETPAWPIERSSIAHYCANDLVPAGIARKVASEGEYRHPYRATRDKGWARKVLAYCGMQIEWSLNPDYKDISLIPLFSNSSGSDSQKMPEIRHKIYRRLLNYPEGSVSTELRDCIGGYNMGTLNHHLLRLGEMGILAVENRLSEYVPRFILNPELATTPYTPVSLLVARAAQELHRKKADQSVTLEDILTICNKLDPTINPADIAKGLRKRPDKELSSLGLTRDPDSAVERVVAAIHPDYKRPLEDFCIQFEALADADVSARYETTARAFVDKDSAIRALIEKARPFKSGRNTPVKPRVLEIVGNIGLASPEEVVAGLQAANVPARPSTVAQYLTDLARAGELTKEASRDSNGRRTVRYQLAPPSKN